MKNVLIISDSFLEKDPRILRQVQAYSRNWHVETLGASPANNQVRHFQLITRKLSERRISLRKVFYAANIAIGNPKHYLYIHYAIEDISKYDFSTPDIIVANQWDGLYIAANLKEKRGWNSKIYYDAHEYSLNDGSTLFWFFFIRPQARFVLRSYRTSFSLMSTVCPTLARMYEKYFGFDQGTVRVITNAPPYEPDLRPKPAGDVIRMVHHGVAMRERQLEKMIDMMACLPADRYELSFMLVHGDNDRYYRSLVKWAGRYPNIHFLDPVPTGQIAHFINQFDIGLFILNNKIINYKYALPNKFFEFVQARLAIAVGDSPEMRSYIDKYHLGVSARRNTPRAMAEEILKLTKDDIMSFKQNADNYARELSAEPNIEAIRQIAAELTV